MSHSINSIACSVVDSEDDQNNNQCGCIPTSFSLGYKYNASKPHYYLIYYLKYQLKYNASKPTTCYKYDFTCIVFNRKK